MPSVSRVEAQHLGHYEQLVLVFLHLRPVVGVQHILQQQAVQAEALAHGPSPHLRSSKPFDTSSQVIGGARLARRRVR
jgi:hypothetical protein